MKKFQPGTISPAKAATMLLMAAAAAGFTARAMAEPFHLGAEEQSFIQNAPPLQGSGSYSTGYGGQAATYDNPGSSAPLQATVAQQRPLQGNVSVALPPAFLGRWSVAGQRTNIEAAPQFQQGVGNLFQVQTQNTWNISGSAQQGYEMSNDAGVSTALNIYKVSKNTAFIRYQHPISKTMAQEAIVLELQNGGATFQGLERLSIVKEGEPQPRAKVTYQLNGRRMR